MRTNLAVLAASHALVLSLGLPLLLPTLASAQEGVLQPAQSAQQRSEASEQAKDGGKAQPEQGHLRSWEAPPIVVTGTRQLEEEELIGEYRQPRWSVARRFPTLRNYVVPAGTLQLDWTLDAHMPLEKLDERRYRSKYELEFGLGHRFQIDFFLQTQQTGSGPGSPIAIRRENIELRWAIAPWGCVWGNPTLYASWGRRHEAPDVAELKLLLGDALAPRWHWGFNVVYERELGEAEEAGYLAIAGLSYSVVDSVFSIGAEVRGEIEDEEGARFEFERGELVAGPSLQWKPQPAMHIDLAVLAGIEKEPGEAEPLLWPWLVIGWEF